MELSNTSSLILENILLKLPLKEGINIVHSSLKLNGTSLPNHSLQLGIPIEFLAPNETAILNFSLSSSLILSEPLYFQANALYKYMDSTYHYLKPQIAYSNGASFSVVKLDFISSLIADQRSVTLNDMIHYTLQLTNNGSCPLNQLIYVHTLYNTAYDLPDSIYIDGTSLDGDLTTGIYLPSLLPHQTYILSYAVRVISGTCSCYLEDHAKLILNNLLCHNEYTIDTPKIKLNIYSFQTIQFERLLTLPHYYPGMSELDSVSCDIIIEDYYTIPSVPAQSVEGQLLTCYQAIVYGYLCVSIEYLPTNLDPTIYCAYFKLPFSTFIVLPNTYTNEPLHFISNIEYIDSHLSSLHTFHLLTSFSIHAQCIH